jgi:GPI mannosyltransferase 3
MRYTLRPVRSLLWLLLALTFAVRVGLAWRVPSIHQADEIYQAAEQANRAVNGFGIESWEFQTASRGAFFAVLVEPIYRLHLSPAASQVLTAAVFSLLSVLPIWVVFAWTSRIYGEAAGLLAAVLTATWFELIYFGPKPTADAVGGYLLIAGLYFARMGVTKPDAALAGFILLVALGARMQIAPAIAVSLMVAFSVHWRQRLVAFGAGAAAGLMLVGAMEWAWWGIPFRGHWGYLQNEFVRHVSSYFRNEPITFYAKTYTLIYGGALPVIAFLALAGARRAPAALLVAAAVIVPFHLFGHKEYRFLLSATPLLVFLMSLGTVDLMMRFAGGVKLTTAALLVTGWLVAMFAMAWSDSYRANWLLDRNHVLAFRSIGAEPDACGVALVGIRWYHTPGYSGLGRDVPIYESGRDESEMARLAPAANYILTGPKSPAPPAPYVRWKAYTRPVEFVYRRPGACVRDERFIVRPSGVPGVVH